MNKERLKIEKRRRRKARVRAKVFGTSKRPRLSIFRSLRHIYVQLIDDAKGETVISANSQEVSNISDDGFNISDEAKRVKKLGVAYSVGELIAKKTLALGIKQIVFDRRGYKYHGRVKAVAEGARKGGLKF